MDRGRLWREKGSGEQEAAVSGRQRVLREAIKAGGTCSGRQREQEAAESGR